MYCIKCGAENPSEAKFCIQCGSTMESSDVVDEQISKTEVFNYDVNQPVNHTSDGTSGGTSMLMGIITLVCGGIGFIYGFTTMQSDKNPKSIWAGGYTYTSPLTDHEKGIIAIICISIAAIIAGIIMLYKSKQTK